MRLVMYVHGHMHKHMYMYMYMDVYLVRAVMRKPTQRVKNADDIFAELSDAHLDLLATEATIING